MTRLEIDRDFGLRGTRRVIWDVLTDPALLKDEIPGLKKFVDEGENSFYAEVSVGVGFIRSKYSGRLKLRDLDEPSGYTMDVDGRGRGGSINGTGSITLAEVTPEETTVNLKGVIEVGGMVGALGEKSVHRAADALMGRFFKKVQDNVESRTTA